MNWFPLRRVLCRDEKSKLHVTTKTYSNAAETTCGETIRPVRKLFTEGSMDERRTILRCAVCFPEVRT